MASAAGAAGVGLVLSPGGTVLDAAGLRDPEGRPAGGLVRRGDRLVAVDGVPLPGGGGAAAVLRGPRGSVARLSFCRRAGGDGIATVAAAAASAGEEPVLFDALRHAALAPPPPPPPPPPPAGSGGGGLAGRLPSSSVAIGRDLGRLLRALGGSSAAGAGSSGGAASAGAGAGHGRRTGNAGGGEGGERAAAALSID